MNTKRLLLAILVVFVALFATDFLVHGLWLQADYKASMTLWRTEAEMKEHFGFLLLGQLLAVVMLVLVWAWGFAARGGLKSACLFGLCMGLFSQATTLITYAVQPLPPVIAVKWLIAGTVQCVLLAMLVSAVYKPKPGTSSSSAHPA